MSDGLSCNLPSDAMIWTIMKPEKSQAFYNYLFRYEDGHLFFKDRPREDFAHDGAYKRWITLCQGQKLTSRLRKDGYVDIRVKHWAMLAHRVIYVMHFGDISDEIEIDHIDGDRSNNNIENLRKSLKSENQMNRKINRNNKSGTKGVKFRDDNGKWRATIKKNKVKYDQQFGTYEEAVSWITAMRNKLHGEFANHGTHRSGLAKSSGDMGKNSIEEIPGTLMAAPHTIWRQA